MQQERDTINEEQESYEPFSYNVRSRNTKCEQRKTCNEADAASENGKCSKDLRQD